jgi:hypothetical protein
MQRKRNDAKKKYVGRGLSHAFTKQNKNETGVETRHNISDIQPYNS